MALEQFPSQTDPTPPVTTVASAVQPYPQPVDTTMSTPSTYPQPGQPAIQPGISETQAALAQQRDIDQTYLDLLEMQGLQLYDPSPAYKPLPRPATDPRFAPQGWTPEQGPYMYQGGGLVDTDGMILTRPNEQGVEDVYYYDASLDAFNLYISSSPSQRLAVMRILNRKGIQTETLEEIVRGYAYLYEQANQLGVAFDVALQRFSVYAPDAPITAEAVYRVTSPTDIKSIAQQTAVQIIGREMPEEDANRFVQIYQNLQRAEGRQAAEGGEVMAAPSISAAAEQFTRERFADRADAYETLNYMDMFFNAARGL